MARFSGWVVGDVDRGGLLWYPQNCSMISRREPGLVAFLEEGVRNKIVPLSSVPFPLDVSVISPASGRRRRRGKKPKPDSPLVDHFLLPPGDRSFILSNHSRLRKSSLQLFSQSSPEPQGGQPCSARRPSSKCGRCRRPGSGAWRTTGAPMGNEWRGSPLSRDRK